MSFFKKKNCDICGNKIGLLGNRKVDDGNMCKDCANKLSPFFSDRKRSTLADVKEQLAYREDNKAAVDRFKATRTLGMNTKVILDDDAKKFIVSTSKNWKQENPDVMDFSIVTGCHLKIDERQIEQFTKDKDGKNVSYSPRRFIHEYDFWFTIYVNHPYFDEIRFKLNNLTVRIEPTGGRIFIQGGSDVGQRSAEYRQYEELADEIKAALTQVRDNVREDIEAARAPKSSVVCALCGASTMPDAGGRCEFCGGPVAG